MMSIATEFHLEIRGCVRTRPAGDRFLPDHRMTSDCRGNQFPTPAIGDIILSWTGSEMAHTPQMSLAKVVATVSHIPRLSEIPGVAAWPNADMI